jgi:hypothetical protein
MSDILTGQPATVQSALPATKNIASTTHATPIVLTTSAAHGLATGDYFIVSGATDPNANGDWMAGTVTLTTVALTAIPTGANSVGTLVGGAVGTLRSYQFGDSITIPTDLTDDRSAASVNVPFESLADEAAYLLYKSQKADAHISTLQDETDAFRGSDGVRVFPFVAADPSSSGQWDRTTTPGAWTQIGVAGINRSLTAHVVLPKGTTITRIDVFVSSSGHGVTLPAVLPTWSLYKVTNTGPTLVTSKADAGPVASYDTNHAISKTGLSVLIDDASFAYTIDLYGEAGGGTAVANALKVYCAVVYITPIA